MPRIKVTSRPESLSRAGLSFTRKPRELKVDDKTFKVLVGDPNLRVMVLSKPVAKAIPSKPEKAAG